MEAPKKNLFQKTVHLSGLYWIYLKLYFKTMVEYRANTMVSLIAGIIAQICSLAFLSIIFQKIPKVGDWNFYELVFIFSLAVGGRALNMVFFNIPYDLTRYIRQGLLDVLMLRPVGPLFQAMGFSQEINGLGNAITAFVIMGYASSNLHIIWTAGKLAYLCVAVLSSMFIQLAVLFTIMIGTFWVQEMRSVIYPVAWLHDFTRYPLDIFNPFMKVLLTYIIPYSVGSFYPAVYLLRPGQCEWALWGVPMTAVVMTFIAYRFWLFGLKHYTSAN